MGNLSVPITTEPIFTTLLRCSKDDYVKWGFASYDNFLQTHFDTSVIGTKILKLNKDPDETLRLKTLGPVEDLFSSDKVKDFKTERKLVGHSAPSQVDSSLPDSLRIGHADAKDVISTIAPNDANVNDVNNEEERESGKYRNNL